MLVKSYQFTGIDFGHLGQLVPNDQKQSALCTCLFKLIDVKLSDDNCETKIKLLFLN